jgi:ubiquinol-cytochrome c reductase cytochrome c subunit
MRRAASLAALLALTAGVPAALAGSSPPAQGIVHAVGSSLAGTASTSALVARGASLYAANCSTCHASAGAGVSPVRRSGAGGVAAGGPPLRNVGALAADFYLRTGFMPLKDPSAQPSRSRVLFSNGEIRAIVAYVATLGKGPAVPRPQPRRGSVAQGMRLFTGNCAGCHQIVGEGGFVTGARVPPLEDASSTQIAEAVRIGPYLMPRFSETAISNGELNDIVAYVQYAKHPDDRGGWSIGHLGPWPEGMVAWLLAGVLLVATCLAIGKRLKT